MAYQDSENKRVIRRVWDAALIEARFSELERPLTYFGLCGPEIHDLLDWKPWLGQRTGVEWTGHTPEERETAQETIGRLLMNVAVHEVSSGFQLLRGEIEDVILDGTDQDGHTPILADAAPAHRQRLSYDLVNLDFVGGFGYRRGRVPAKRVAALRRLFERQRGYDFLLLLTVNLRHTLGRDFQDFLRGLTGRLRSKDCCQNLEWYLRRGAGQSVQKLKATIPCWVRANAEPQQFRCAAYPPIYYEGHEGARMLHFVFDLRSSQGDLGAFSTQNDSELIDLPLLEAVDGQLRYTAEQHPTFDVGRAAALLGFLDPEVRAAIIATAPQAVSPTRRRGRPGQHG